MTFTEKDILEVIRVFNESDAEELKLEKGDLKLMLRKGWSGKGESRVPLLSGISEPKSGGAETEVPGVAALAEAVPPNEVGHQSAEEERFHPVKAPLMGIFYRSSKPGAPSLVEVGAEVNEDTTLCLIEVMKLFTGVKAGVRGRIRKICVENAKLVEYQQTLFLIDSAE